MLAEAKIGDNEWARTLGQRNSSKLVNSKLISSNQPECGDRQAGKKSEDPKGLNENMAPEEEVTETEQQKNDTVGDIESIAVLD